MRVTLVNVLNSESKIRNDGVTCSSHVSGTSFLKYIRPKMPLHCAAMAKLKRTRFDIKAIVPAKDDGEHLAD
ncbi:hypothetical protein FHX11_001125 [Rhizobium sp. BK602]|nr:hypothetical protein [Rhizobium sp. BK602]